MLEYAIAQNLITERSINLWLGDSKGTFDGHNGELPPNGRLTWGGYDEGLCGGDKIDAHVAAGRSLNMTGYRVNANETLTQTSVSCTCFICTCAQKICFFC